MVIAILPWAPLASVFRSDKIIAGKEKEMSEKQQAPGRAPVWKHGLIACLTGFAPKLGRMSFE
jgi:hypothetical protein